MSQWHLHMFHVYSPSCNHLIKFVDRVLFSSWLFCGESDGVFLFLPPVFISGCTISQQGPLVGTARELSGPPSFSLSSPVRKCTAAAAAAKLSDSVQPHRWQPTRLPYPWDSPGKNTGVGCHFLLQCIKVKSESEVTQSCLTLRDPMDCSLPGSSVHGIF